MRLEPNSRVHLPGGSVTALARKPRKMNHHQVPPGPRRTSPAGDATVRHGGNAASACQPPVWIMIVLLLIACCTLPSAAEIFDGCGEIIVEGDCRVFYPYGLNLQECLLPDTLQLPNDLECRITGTVLNPWAECDGLPGYKSLVDVVVRPCEPESLGCGVLEPFGDSCVVWRSLVTPGDLTLLDDFGGFATGDTVLAVGVRAFSIPDVCICACGLLLHTTLTACPDTLSPIQPMTWGRLRVLYRR
jgi:hypothetical protein